MNNKIVREAKQISRGKRVTKLSWLQKQQIPAQRSKN
jgi:hypothetical protein